MTRSSFTTFFRQGLFGILLLGGLFGTMSANAERADRDKPINFSADIGDAINHETKVATLTGNVIITQGTMTIRADRVILRQNPDNTMSATAHGKPVSFRQKRDDSDEYVEAYALRAEYDGQKDVLELFDQALLKQGVDEIRSDYIYYNSATEIFRSGLHPDSAASGQSTASQRTEGVWKPKDKESESKPPKPPASLKSDTALEPR